PVVEHRARGAVELKCPREGFYRESQLIERVKVFAFGRDLRESETRKVRGNHAVGAGQARKEFAEHERRGWESMQQEDYRRVGVSCRTIKRLYAVGFDPLDGCGRPTESAEVAGRRRAFCPG